MRNEAIQTVATSNQFLTPAELAAELQIKIQTLAVWRCKGGGPPFTRCMSAIRYRRDAVDAWLASSTATSIAQLEAAV